jgi:hypothetical protein
VVQLHFSLSLASIVQGRFIRIYGSRSLLPRDDVLTSTFSTNQMNSFEFFLTPVDSLRRLVYVGDVIFLRTEKKWTRLHFILPRVSDGTGVADRSSFRDLVERLRIFTFVIFGPPFLVDALEFIVKSLFGRCP